MSVCTDSYNLPSPLGSYITPSLVLAAALLILAVMQTSKQSFDLYKVTKKWQPNRYTKLLVRDGILYFIVYVCIHCHISPCLSVDLYTKTDHSDDSLSFLGNFSIISPSF